MIETTTINEFLRQTPTCGLKEPLGMVLAALQSQLESGTNPGSALNLTDGEKHQQGETPTQDQCLDFDVPLVVLDQRHRPVGLIRLTKMMPYFLGERHSKWSRLSLDLAQPLSDLPQLLEPLSQIPETTTLAQFWLLLSRTAPAPTATRHWAVVDSTGKYLGLLDLWQVTQEVSQSQQYLLPQAATKRPSWNHASSLNSAYTEQTVSALIELLEQLPLPLMLQTSAGQVLTQNLAWQQQVIQLSDPTRLTQDVAALLDYNLQPERTTLQDPAISLAQSEAHFQIFTPSMAGDSPLALGDPAFAMESENMPLGETASWGSSLCQLDSEPNSCVCICPLEGGQQRVWRFFKLPVRLHPMQIGEAVSAEMRFPEAEKFQLATLGANCSLSVALQTAYNTLMRSELLWLVVAEDVTADQLNERLTAEKTELTHLNQLKDELLTSIGHELKASLSSILGLSTVLKDYKLGELSDRQSRYVQLIHRSGRQLLTVVNHILDLARLETNQLALVPETIAIRCLCEQAYKQALQLYEFELEAASTLQFKLEIAPDVEYCVADEVRLGQMLVHLLSNALKFTPAQRQIGLQVRRCQGWLAFTVWDQGIGIPAHQQHLIFQKFQKPENPVHQKFQGSGLGLILTQRLVRLHKGEITFTSEEGQGSQFTLLLPLGEEPARSDRLVVIANANSQQVEELSAALTTLDYWVVIARTGPEAIAKIQLLQPRVVFLNPSLPLLSGWQVLTLSQRNPTTCQIPMIITGSLTDKPQATQNGASDFLSFPVQALGLEQSLARLTYSPVTDITGDTNLQATVANAVSLTSQGSSAPTPHLTVLYLSSKETNLSLPWHHCRVLEADDLTQAELLARIWQPQVILYTCDTEPLPHLQQLSQHPTLANLPLVTLTPETTWAAQQVPGLQVYPCLMAEDQTDGATWDPAILLQVLQMAVSLS